ncbi:cytochrome c3 family protein [Acidobacteriota bacterium]
MQTIKNRWIVVCLLAFTSSTFGQISGSAHDFSATVHTWNTTGEICIVCHTPHNADTTVPDAPLWNHEVTTAVFTLYSSPTMDIAPSQPEGVSRLCLSCHDGTIALDSYGGATGTTNITGDYNLTTDLSDDHPVSIFWDHQTEDPEGACGKCHSQHGGQITNPYLPFFDQKVECATCHDVHNTSTYTKLLRLPLAGSELCLYCHGK